MEKIDIIVSSITRNAIIHRHINNSRISKVIEQASADILAISEISSGIHNNTWIQK
jgi:hypothetical protein